MAKQTRTAAEKFLDEPIRLPGVPSVVMSRADAYTWLIREAGMSDKAARGFASLDYLCFGARAVNEPLTDTTDPAVARFLALVARAMRADADDAAEAA